MSKKIYNFKKAMQYGTEYKSFKSAGGRIISPSSLAKRIQNPNIWYQDFCGTNPNPFNGNLATIKGSLVHASIEAYFLNSTIEVSHIQDWLKEKSLYIPEIIGKEHDIIKNAEDAMNIFVKKYPEAYSRNPEYLEKYLEVKLTDDIMLAGTIDGIIKNDDGHDTYTIIDWKTSSFFKKNFGDYGGQLYSYVKMARLNGINVTRIAIGYIVNPTKTIQHRVKFVDEPVDENKLCEIEILIDNTVKAVDIVESNPEVSSEILFPSNCFFGSYLASEPRELASLRSPGKSIIKGN